ncbi:HK97 gp10 family phage protein [Enterocloster clostridioformis]|jgi:hypothetical protein
MEDGFYIENLDKLEQKLLKAASKEFPQIIQNILETLGEIILNSAKDSLKSDTRPHARYVKKTRTITRGANKGKQKNYLQFKGTVSTNAIDTGALWNSLSRGINGNVWVYNGSAGRFSLCVGSSVSYARFINDGYTMRTPHWVPGTIDGTGKFIYQPGAKTGIWVKPRVYKGVKFFDIGFEEMKKEAPEVVRYELERFAAEFNK